MQSQKILNASKLGVAIAALSIATFAPASTTITKNISLNSWIGQEDTVTTYEGQTSRVEVIITSDSNCDLENYLLCDDASAKSFSFWDSAPSIETATRLDQTGFYNFTAGSTTEQVSMIPLRNGPERNTIYGSTVFNGKLWLFGGSTPSSRRLDYSNEIWSSSNGIQWKKEKTEAPFNKSWPEAYTITEFDGNLWYFNRDSDGADCYSRIWKSSDGISWTEIEDDELLVDNCLGVSNLVAFNGRLWAIGQFTRPQVLRSSSDGISWTEETAISEINNWAGARATTQDTDGDGIADRVWLAGEVRNAPGVQLAFSDDMENWTLISEQDTGIAGFQYITTHSDQLLISTYSEEGIEYHTSEDGYTWNHSSPSPAVSARYNYELASFKGQVLSIGGTEILYPETNQDIGLKSDFILKSSDLISWENVYEESEVLPAGAGIAVLQSSLNTTFAIGGMTPDGLNDSRVWRSLDLINWIQEDQAPLSELTPRAFHQIAPIGTSVFGSESEYLMTGGLELEDTDPVVLRANQSDMTLWTADSNTNLTKAELHQMTNFGERLLIIGGLTETENGAPESGVLESIDGSNWTAVATNHSFKDLQGHRTVHFQNEIWIIGGFAPDGASGIWSSPDGISWTERSASADFGARGFFSVTLHEGLLVLTGGLDQEYNALNDTWVSTDGTTWNKSENNLPETMAGHVSFDSSSRVFPTPSPSEIGIFILGGDISSDSQPNGLLKTNISDSLADIQEWRKYGSSSVELEVIAHTVRALNSEDGNVITQSLIYDTETANISIASDGVIESAASTCGGALDGTAYVIDQVTSDCDIIVTYAPDIFEVTAIAVGAGSISPELLTVEAGSVATLTVEPDSWWYIVDSVSGCGGSMTNANTYTTAPIDSDCSVTATFAPWWNNWFR